MSENGCKHELLVRDHTSHRVTSPRRCYACWEHEGNLVDSTVDGAKLDWVAETSAGFPPKDEDFVPWTVEMHDG